MSGKLEQALGRKVFLVCFSRLCFSKRSHVLEENPALHLCARCETAASSGLQSTMHQLLEIKMRGWDKSNEGFLRPLERIDTSLTLSRTWFISLKRGPARDTACLQTDCWRFTTSSEEHPRAVLEQLVTSKGEQSCL